MKGKKRRGRNKKFTDAEEVEIVERVKETPFVSWLLLATWFKLLHSLRPIPSEATLTMERSQFQFR